MSKIQTNFKHFWLVLKQGVTHHFDKLEFPTTPYVFVPSLVEIAQWFWRRRRKCTKKKITEGLTYRQMVRLSPDKKWSEENHLNFQHRWDKNLNVTRAMCICSIQCFAMIVIAGRLLYIYRQSVDQRIIRTCNSICRHRCLNCLWFGSKSKNYHMFIFELLEK